MFFFTATLKKKHTPKAWCYKISSGSAKFREANANQRPHQNLLNLLHQYKAEGSGMFPKR